MFMITAYIMVLIKIPQCHMCLYEAVSNSRFFTEDPFETCVIVEYCKYGCLREFLRLNRKKALYTEYTTSDESSSIHGLPRGKDVVKRYDIGCKEIASFAWQICKGMHYISSLKVSLE